MPRNSPEYQRERRHRLIAEGRCDHCGRVRDEGEKVTQRCRRCREAVNQWALRRHANRRAKSPPELDIGDPREPFRFGRVRLDDRRELKINVDGGLAEVLGVVRMGFVRSHHYEAKSRSIFVRTLLALPMRLGAEARVHPRPPVRRGDWVIGGDLHFWIDGEIDGVLKRYRGRTGRRQAEAVRDILFWSCSHLISTHNGMLRPSDPRGVRPDEFYAAVAAPQPRPSERPRHHSPALRVFPSDFSRGSQDFWSGVQNGVFE